MHACHVLLLFVLLSQVQPKHVKEAFRLLNRSIIRVETPDINFEEEEQQIMDMENGVCVCVRVCACVGVGVCVGVGG